MFASMRRYRLERGTMDELARRIDEDFAVRLAVQPGFVAYEFVNCGFGKFMTMSVFSTLEQAEASRDLARRWAEEHSGSFSFPRLEAAHGEILVGRAAEGMLDESHIGSARKPVTIWRYRIRQGSVEDLMHKVDRVFADRFGTLEGFEAWHAFECGEDEFLWIAYVSNLSVAEETDEWASRFLREELREFGLQRRSSARGELLVSRVAAGLLEPAHA
jgi:hypothetical protein